MFKFNLFKKPVLYPAIDPAKFKHWLRSWRVDNTTSLITRNSFRSKKEMFTLGRYKHTLVQHKWYIKDDFELKWDKQQRAIFGDKYRG